MGRGNLSSGEPVAVPGTLFILSLTAGQYLEELSTPIWLIWSVFWGTEGSFDGSAIEAAAFLMPVVRTPPVTNVTTFTRSSQLVVICRIYSSIP